MVYQDKKDKEAEWDSKYDIEKIRMTGFVAQEVEQAADEAGYNFSGIQKPEHSEDLYSLRYADFVVPLVKAVQEQQQMLTAQEEAIQKLRSANEELQEQLLEIKQRLGMAPK
jgi:hypothetical protein